MNRTLVNHSMSQGRKRMVCSLREGKMICTRKAKLQQTISFPRKLQEYLVSCSRHQLVALVCEAQLLWSEDAASVIGMCFPCLQGHRQICVSSSFSSLGRLMRKGTISFGLIHLMCMREFLVHLAKGNPQPLRSALASSSSVS